MSTEKSRRPGALSLPSDRRALAVTATMNLGLVLALGCWPVTASAMVRHKVAHQERAAHKDAGRISKEPFGNIPKGPLQIFISINQQKLHLYSDGVHIADSSVATGVVSLPTPLGVFSVIQKQVFHRSNIYSNAPMPYMQRITWSGVALHEGENIGHRASHGCIRMPREFAARLYGLTKIGARVIIANGELKPSEFADPHLFVHKDRPADQTAAAPAAAPAVQTAQTTDGNKKDDAAPTDAAMTVQPTALGLRVGSDPVVADAAAGDPPKPVAPERNVVPAAPAAVVPVNAAPDVSIPAPPAKPADLAKAAPAKKTPIAIFVSRKEKKIYVRQDFEPLFDAAITIEHPDEPLGTHVFTAMNYLDDHATFRWTVVSLPGDPPKRKAENEDRSERHARRRHRDDDDEKSIAEPPQTPVQALARINIPQAAIDSISESMVPGSSIVVSDHGLGDETGEGTDFIVVTR